MVLVTKFLDFVGVVVVDMVFKQRLELAAQDRVVVARVVVTYAGFVHKGVLAMARRGRPGRTWAWTGLSGTASQPEAAAEQQPQQPGTTARAQPGAHERLAHN